MFVVSSPNSQWKWGHFSRVQTGWEVPLRNACDNCQGATKYSITSLINPFSSSINSGMKPECIFFFFSFNKRLRDDLQCKCVFALSLECYRDMLAPWILYVAQSLHIPLLHFLPHVSQSLSKTLCFWNSASGMDRGSFFSSFCPTLMRLP